mmetsp:Transcript_33755/g.93255  ORF Transcript_33755/g.93255 Transcript_33755/m.93255 type:complete len:449 (-) Transcript_33755:495-1841(-)
MDAAGEAVDAADEDLPMDTADAPCESVDAAEEELAAEIAEAGDAVDVDAGDAAEEGPATTALITASRVSGGSSKNCAGVRPKGASWAAVSGQDRTDNDAVTELTGVATDVGVLKSEPAQSRRGLGNPGRDVRDDRDPLAQPPIEAREVSERAPCSDVSEGDPTLGRSKLNRAEGGPPRSFNWAAMLLRTSGSKEVGNSTASAPAAAAASSSSAGPAAALSRTTTRTTERSPMHSTASPSLRLRRGKAIASEMSPPTACGGGCHGASASSRNVNKNVFKSPAKRRGRKRRRSCLPLGRRKQISNPSLPSPRRARSSSLTSTMNDFATAFFSSNQRARLSSASCWTWPASVCCFRRRSLYSTPLSARSGAGRKSTRTSWSPKTPAFMGIFAASTSVPFSSSRRATNTGSMRDTTSLWPCNCTGTESPDVSAGMSASAACSAERASSPTMS